MKCRGAAVNCSPEVGLRNSVQLPRSSFCVDLVSCPRSKCEAAVAWFEKGIADNVTVSLLGVARSPVDRIHRRWRIRDRER